MAVIVYGTHVFTKLAGYFGPREECPFCHRVYQKGYVKNSVWAHLEYIPLFPVKKTYFKMCPVCGRGLELKSKEAKAEMAGSGAEYQKRTRSTFWQKNPRGLWLRMPAMSSG